MCKGVCSKRTDTLWYYQEKIPGDILAKIGQPTRIKEEGIPIVKYDLTPYGIFDDE